MYKYIHYSLNSLDQTIIIQTTILSAHHNCLRFFCNVLNNIKFLSYKFSVITYNVITLDTWRGFIFIVEKQLFVLIEGRIYFYYIV